MVFQSDATNLVEGDTNALLDVFVRDRLTNKTTRVNVASDGTQAMGGTSRQPTISADGRYIAFNSGATNLVPNDLNVRSDIFIRDTVTKTTTRISVAPDGSEANHSSAMPSISADGRYVSFRSTATNLTADVDTNNDNDIFVRDLKTNTTTKVSVSSDGEGANAGCFKQWISANGRFVVFQSGASNLVPGDTNDRDDIFVRDLDNNTTERVSVSTDGVQGNNGGWHPVISADGRYVAFWSASSNLVEGDTNFIEDVFVHDRETHETTRVSVANDGTERRGASETPSISYDGRYVGFRSWSAFTPNDDNGVDDVYVHDRLTHTTSLVSVTLDGTSGTGPGGRFGAGINTNGSRDAIISPDGHYMAFKSLVTDLVENDKNGGAIVNGVVTPGIDVFLRDLTLIKDETANLSVTQRTSPAKAKNGKPFSFIATVTNNGTDAATNVNLTNVFLGSYGADLVSIEPNQGECMNTSPAICRLGTLAAGESATVTVNLNATAKGTVNNHVSVNASQKDPSAKNNISSKAIKIK
ncbi:CARDB domain-containing protein [Methylocucumis oryzae]|uniref:CARDB domain-containing protein n=1 Tax=Methylocucumis oryzae TaxID=1632867 RepID=UPI000A9A1539|nr:CARDB domain-containing protein [Methylocucumis oryzae]